jgi:hypothetical protein
MAFEPVGGTGQTKENDIKRKSKETPAEIARREAPLAE